MTCTNKMVAGLTIGVAVAVAQADGFTNPSSWKTYDYGASLGCTQDPNCTDPDGYWRAVFDGRFIYFSPISNGVGGVHHGEVLRYDTIGPFDASSSWASYDYGEDPLGCAQDPNCNDPDGYDGAVFDGRYVYFAPLANDVGNSGWHGEVLRYDTNGGFATASSWATYDAKNNPPNAKGGYRGVVFDGQRYVYFVPGFDGTNHHGEVLRLDTQGVFDAESSWTKYDPGDNSVGTDPDGYNGAIVDSAGFIYFVPFTNEPNADPNGAHAEVLRYDTSGPFTDAASWAAFDPQVNDVGDDPRGFQGGTYDGRFIYFAPSEVGIEGEVLRFDTQGSFGNRSSWSTFDPGANEVGSDPDGYRGAVFDGQRYIYFVPFHNGTEYHGEVLRYDTLAPFAVSASWSTFDPGGSGVGTFPDGYVGGVFDGQYVYFVPHEDVSGVFHGEVLRYDTLAACCQTNADCNDANVCTQDLCIDGTCVNSGKTYGDVDNDGGIDLFDLFCILDCFENDFSICPFEKCDIEPCEGDADTDLFDLFAVINAFSGDDPCCGG